MLTIDNVGVFDAGEHALHPTDDHHFLGLRCTSGITGWYGPVPASLAAPAAQRAAGLRGHSLTLQRLPHLVARIEPTPTSRRARAAIGVLDGALWDVLGQAAGVPVAHLLAARPTAGVPAYLSWLNLDLSTPRNLDSVPALAGSGWVHTKWAVRAGHHDLADALAERITTIRRAAAQPVAIDALGTWNPTLLAHLAAQQPVGLLWLEDPLPPGPASLPGGLPIALGEHCTTPAALAAVTRDHRPEVLTPDVLWLGGIRATQQALLGLGQQHPPIWLHGRAFAPALHLAAAYPQRIAGIEYQHYWWPRRMALLAEPFPTRPGYLPVPARPGLGLTPKGTLGT